MSLRDPFAPCACPVIGLFAVTIGPQLDVGPQFVRLHDPSKSKLSNGSR